MLTHTLPARPGLTILLLALIGTVLPAAPPAPEPLVVENLTLRLVLQANGTIGSLVLKPDRELADRAPARALMRLETGTGWRSSSGLDWQRQGDGYRLRARFQGTPVEAVAVLRAHADHFEFETVGLEGAGREQVKRWTYASVFSTVKRNTGSWLNVDWDDDAALALLALDERTEARGAPILQATALARLGFAGRKAALVATATPALLDVVRRIERQHGLPSPTVGGQWAKTAAETRRSWMISGLSAAGKPAEYAPERVFQAAEQLGVRTVVISLGWWNASFGSYSLNVRNFPGGVESLRAVARQAHARGLKLGLHVMTRSITKNDPLVTPRPDPRLCIEGELSLATDLDASARELTTRESPQSFGAAEGYWVRGGMDVWIDDEIIHYGGLREQAPFGLVDCRRGANGTKAAPHRAGAKVRHITERYGWYVAGAELGAEIGRRLAELINAAELDAICFDGADVQADPAVNFFEGHQVAQGVYRHARRDVLLFSNGTTHFGWHLMARGGEEDAMARGYQGWVDYRTVAEWAGWHMKNFMPPDLAWVGIFGTTPTMTACRPDDIEMVCARSLGLDASIGWGLAACYGGPSSVVEWERNGRRDEIGQVARAYERVRAERLLGPAQRQPMAELGTHWRLLAPDATHPGWRRVPVDYRKGPVFSGPPQEAWRVVNRFAAQPLRVRIEALPAVAAFGAPENKVLVDVARHKFTTTGDPFVVPVWERINALHPQAGAVLRLRARDMTPGATHSRKLGRGSEAWAEATVELPEPVDLRRHRALGLWIHGDGGGEVLNVQVMVDRQSYLHYYQPIDFRGWKFCELGEPEGDRVMEYFQYEKFAMHDLRLDKVRTVMLMILKPPPGRPVDLRIGRIEALAELGGRVEQPRLTVGDQELRLPVALEPGQYLETGDLWGTLDPHACRVFDAHGKELTRHRVEHVPTVPQGPASLHVGWGGQPPARAKATVILMGND